MIYESFPWKQRLLRLSRSIAKSAKDSSWNEAKEARFEQNVMLGFYIIRKLFEAKKLSNETLSFAIPLKIYPPTGRDVTLTNWHKIDELFELEVPTEKEYDLLFVCNQIIHSYIFLQFFDHHDCPAGIYFASDRQRRKSLLSMSNDLIVSTFERCGRDYPNESKMSWDSELRDYVVENSMCIRTVEDGNNN